MNKLTAGIFSVLVGLVSVNAADAAVASKGYVDAKTGENATAITNLTTTVATNATDAAAATKKVADDLTAYVTKNDAAVAAKVAQSDYNTKVEALEAADTSLDGRIAEVEKLTGSAEGSVASQIATALTTAQGYADTAESKAKTYTNEQIAALSAEGGAIKALQTADAELDTRVTTAEGEIDALQAADIAINTTIGTVEAGKTVVGLIAEAKQAATDANSGLETRVEAIENDNYTQTEFEEFNTKNTAAIATAKSEAIADAKAETESQVKALAEGAVAANTAEFANYTKTADLGMMALANVPETCSSPANYCVLTYNNTGFYWEVIERVNGEALPGGGTYQVQP